MGWKLNDMECELFERYGNDNIWVDFAMNRYNVIGLSYLEKLNLLYRYKMEMDMIINEEIAKTKENLFGNLDMNRYFLKRIFFEDQKGVRFKDQLVIPYKFYDGEGIDEVKCSFYDFEVGDADSIESGLCDWINLDVLFRGFIDITPYCMGLGKIDITNDDQVKNVYKRFLEKINN